MVSALEGANSLARQTISSMQMVSCNSQECSLGDKEDHRTGEQRLLGGTPSKELAGVEARTDGQTQ